jgi:hypothetical protein
MLAADDESDMIKSKVIKTNAEKKFFSPQNFYPILNIFIIFI